MRPIKRNTCADILLHAALRPPHRPTTLAAKTISRTKAVNLCARTAMLVALFYTFSRGWKPGRDFNLIGFGPEPKRHLPSR